MLIRKKAQSTVEYVIVVSAIIIVATLFLLSSRNTLSPFQNKMHNVYSSATNGAVGATKMFTDSLSAYVPSSNTGN